MFSGIHNLFSYLYLDLWKYQITQVNKKKVVFLDQQDYFQRDISQKLAKSIVVSVSLKTNWGIWTSGGQKKKWQADKQYLKMMPLGN